MDEDKSAALEVGKRIAGGHGLSGVLLGRASEVELDWDLRQRSRIAATDSRGRSLEVFLPRGTVLRGGRRAGGGGRFADPGEGGAAAGAGGHARPRARHAFDLLRAAYHLGNRHVPLELQPDRLLLEPDHVLADMLRRQHLVLTEATSAFEPEAGAYGAGGGHARHSHAHAHGHAH